MSGQIEVGDVVTHNATGSVEYTVTRIVDGVTYNKSDGKSGYWLLPENCQLVRKAGQSASTAPKSWQFRHDPWVPPQPKTLADVPEGASAIVMDAAGHWIVAYRVGTQGFHQGGGEYCGHAESLRFIRYLDPPQPAPLRIEDVPDCRCIQVPGNINHYWRHQGNWHEYIPYGGWIRSAARAAEFTQFIVTDYIAEFK